VLNFRPVADSVLESNGRGLSGSDT
jgi:hypothetical protein